MRFMRQMFVLTAVLGFGLVAAADQIGFGSPTNRTLTPTVSNPAVSTYNNGASPSGSASFIFAGQTITIYGYALAGTATNDLQGQPAANTCPAGPSNCLADLALNQRGPNETGVGLLGDPQGDAEISSATYLAIDLSSLVGKSLGGTTSLDLVIQSVQTPDSYTIRQGGGPVGTLSSNIVFTGSNPGTGGVTQNVSFSLAGLNSTNDIFYITGATVDILVNGTNTPEPAGIFFFGTGLLGLATVARRKLLS